MRKTRTARMWAIALAGILSAGGGLLGSTGHATAAGKAGPRFPAKPNIDNPLFPVQPGTTYIYDGTTGSAPEHEVATVTSKIVVITGIPSRQVVDSNWVSGELVERTLDWYAQDYSGNVWYMGEYATQYKHGKPIGHAGSWQSGKNGAKGGIIMEANPRVGDTYSQEDAPDVAEDRGKVLSVDASVSTPFGNWINNVLLTKDYTLLDSGVEHKYYVPRIGLVKSKDVKGGSEVLELTGIKHSQTP